MDPPHAEPPGTVTDGHCDWKPIALGVKSSPPPHCLSPPPHALQMCATLRDSAFAIAVVALPSPGSGQGPGICPAFTVLQHFASAFDFERRNAAGFVPIAF